MAIKTVKGTREFYPEDMALRNFLYGKAGSAARSFGYQEYDGPFLETIDLYAAKSGEELVKKQSFTFADRGGDLVTLRPELTPSLARMIAAKQNELAFPVRWWSFGPFWRYEQPQKGRTREFFQWNIDMLGVDSPEADAELIAVGVEFLKSVGLSAADVTIFVNNRRLMEREFDALEIPLEKRSDVSNMVDRRPKTEEAKWDSWVLDSGFSPAQLNGLKALLADFDLWKKNDELVRLFAMLEAFGAAEYVKFDPNIMRGLLYYTGTVFEAFDVSGSVKRSLFGGGRYDKLLADVGGQPLSGVGFAMGDVGMGILLREKGLVPDLALSPARVLVSNFDANLSRESCALAAELRIKGIPVMWYPEPVKLQKQFRYADRMNVRLVLTIGPDEVSQGAVVLKDLKTGGQSVIRRNEIAEAVAAALGT